jgi:putative ABC transport system permease protein
VPALVRLAPPNMPRLRDVALDGTTILFAIALVVASGIVFGMLSAFRALSSDPVRSLGRLGGDGHVVMPRASRRRLDALAASALALTVLLLVAAGLLLRSFAGVLGTDQGFESDGGLALQITLPASRYPSPDARLAFHDRLLERIRQIPGIQHAGLTTSMPNRQPTGRFDFNPVDVPFSGEPMSRSISDVRMVSGGFLEAMGLGLIAGRTFRPDDRAGAEPVMVISEDLARQHFPNRQAVGEMLYSGTGDRRVVGVVTTVKPATDGRPPSPAAYLPLHQAYDVLEWMATVTVVLRGPDAEAASAAVRSLVLSLDPDMPTFNVRTLDEEVSRLVAPQRFSATVLGAFAATALVLASLGVYGVVSYSTRMRTREIGVRLALGATRAGILRLVLREGAIIVGAGGGMGLLMSTWLAQSLTGLLHEVQPADPVALMAVAGVLMIVGGLAAYLPARRATRIRALDALREH